MAASTIRGRKQSRDNASSPRSYVRRLVMATRRTRLPPRNPQPAVVDGCTCQVNKNPNIRVLHIPWHRLRGRARQALPACCSQHRVS